MNYNYIKLCIALIMLSITIKYSTAQSNHISEESAINGYESLVSDNNSDQIIKVVVSNSCNVTISNNCNNEKTVSIPSNNSMDLNIEKFNYKNSVYYILYQTTSTQENKSNDFSFGEKPLKTTNFYILPESKYKHLAKIIQYESKKVSVIGNVICSGRVPNKDHKFNKNIIHHILTSTLEKKRSNNVEIIICLDFDKDKDTAKISMTRTYPNKNFIKFFSGNRIISNKSNISTLNTSYSKLKNIIKGI